MTKRSTKILESDFKRIIENPNSLYSVGLKEGIYKWEIMIFGPQDTPYEGGIFKAIMEFPDSYPEDPPIFIFTTPMFHPNIEKTGRVCISILHKSGNDQYGYEEMFERWLPVQNAETVIMSIVDLLTSPNVDSPANLDASKTYKESRKDYEKIVRKMSQKTIEDL